MLTCDGEHSSIKLWENWNFTKSKNSYLRLNYIIWFRSHCRCWISSKRFKTTKKNRFSLKSIDFYSFTSIRVIKKEHVRTKRVYFRQIYNREMRIVTLGECSTRKKTILVYVFGYEKSIYPYIIDRKIAEENPVRYQLFTHIPWIFFFLFSFRRILLFKCVRLL